MFYIDILTRILSILDSDNDIVEIVNEVKAEEFPNEKAFVNVFDQGFVKAEDEEATSSKYIKKNC